MHKRNMAKFCCFATEWVFKNEVTRLVSKDKRPVLEKSKNPYQIYQVSQMFVGIKHSYFTSQNKKQFKWGGAFRLNIKEAYKLMYPKIMSLLYLFHI